MKHKLTIAISILAAAEILLISPAASQDEYHQHPSVCGGSRIIFARDGGLWIRNSCFYEVKASWCSAPRGRTCQPEYGNSVIIDSLESYLIGYDYPRDHIYRATSCRTTPDELYNLPGLCR